MELEGLSAKLSLSESNSGNSSDEVDIPSERRSKVHKHKHGKKINYSKMVLIYEENAPFPPANIDDI